MKHKLYMFLCPLLLCSAIAMSKTPAPAPSGLGPVNGTMSVCAGSSTQLTDIVSGGTWSSVSTGVATISSTGLVTGVAAGTTTISYSSGISTVTAVVTVNATPSAILGTSLNVCPAATFTLSDTSAGGTWSSANITVATVSSAGMVSGIVSGATVISYSYPTGCAVTAAIAVLPVPVAITGNKSVCLGLTSTLSDLTAGGTWSSSAPVTASVGTGAGLVSGGSLGTATISYTGINGCSTTTTVTVNAQPSGIYGNVPVCPGLSTTLGDLTGGGTWSSANQLTATVGSSSGTVTGVNAGTVTLTYTANTTCFTTAVFTVNPFPAAIGGTTNVCLNSTTLLTDATTPGSWGSSSPGIASIDPFSGLVTGNAVGSATITYTLPTTCIATATVIVTPLPDAITGPSSVCSGLTITLSDDITGGTWASNTVSVASVNGTTGVVTGFAEGSATITYTSAIGCSITTEVVVNPLPDAITGTLLICPLTTVGLADDVLGGSWNTGDASIATIDIYAGAITGVGSGTTGVTYTLGTGCIATTVVTVGVVPAAISGTLSICPGTSTTLTDLPAGGTWSAGGSGFVHIGIVSGTLTGLASGTANITYTDVQGCTNTGIVTVLPVAPITGTLQVCSGLTTSLTDALSGGTWSSSGAPATIAIGSTGVVTGNAAGSAIVTYTLPTTCMMTTVVTVNPLPSAILGALVICQNSVSTLTDAATGGSWNVDPSGAGVALVDGLGHLTGLGAGTALITYTLPTGCITTTVVTVNPVPDPISGAMNTCAGLNITLSDGTPGGTWSSSNTAYATVGTSGIVAGGLAGYSTIAYTLPTGCLASILFTTNPLPAAILGSRSICKSTPSSLSDVNTGGTWSISGPAGVATINLTTGTVLGFILGVDTVTYTLPTGCIVKTLVTVNPYPAAISGVSAVCQTNSVILTDSVIGGTWASSNTAKATVTSLTGIVSGITAGTASISYTPVTGCTVIKTITVNPLAAISGNLSVCAGSLTLLSDIVTGGTWASSAVATGTISATGVVAAITAGNTYITYTLPTGCTTTAVLTVNPKPATFDVTGGGTYCEGGTGLHVGLNGSDTGVKYQLYYGASAMPDSLGTGSPIDFGLHTGSGSYVIYATNINTSCVIEMLGSANIAITNSVVPTVSVASLSGDTVCVGSTVTFSAAPVNGGTAPLYAWHINSVTVTSGTSATYTYIPVNHDSVSVTLTSNAVCVVPDTAMAHLKMTTILFDTTTLSIHVSPLDSVCPGTPVTITPTSTNGGSSPVYMWTKNGLFAAFGPTYHYVPQNGDNIFCTMQSSITCATPASINSSNNIHMIVPEIYTPIVSITAYPGTRIKFGELDSLVATVAFGGISYTYQWELNGVAVSGATTNHYVSSSLASHDAVSCMVTGLSVCGSASQAAEVIIIDTVTAGVIEGSNGDLDITLVPNPNNGTFTVSGTLPQGTDNAAIRIMDMLGRVVSEQNIIIQNGKVKEQLRLGNTVANGAYLMELVAGEQKKVIHFVVGQ